MDRSRTSKTTFATFYSLQSVSPCPCWIRSQSSTWSIAVKSVVGYDCKEDVARIALSTIWTNAGIAAWFHGVCKSACGTKHEHNVKGYLAAWLKLVATHLLGCKFRYPRQRWCSGSWGWQSPSDRSHSSHTPKLRSHSLACPVDRCCLRLGHTSERPERYVGLEHCSWRKRRRNSWLRSMSMLTLS